jgi:DNA-binding NarL/FixJ family response regulator
MITIVIADDHAIARAGIHSLLSSDPALVIVGEAEDGLEVQELVAKLRPNILLLDLKMPGPRPSDIERYVRTHYPETITLVLTSHDRDVYLAEMVEAGVKGYFPKSMRGESLIKAIHRAAEGENLITEMQRKRITQWRGKFTEMEWKVLSLMSRGLSNAAISTELEITHRTVTFHVANLFEKLGVKSRQQVILWIAKNLLDD